MQEFIYKLPEGVEVEKVTIEENIVVVTVKEKDCLKLVIDNNYMSASYKKELIARISNDGELFTLNTEARRAAYLKWISDGMPTSNEEVCWRGCFYKIVECRLKNLTVNTNIYDFEKARPIPSCLDENIARYEHCNTPILY